jgi:hypothetical protein
LALKAAFAKVDAFACGSVQNSDRSGHRQARKKKPLHILMGIGSGKFTASKVKKFDNLALERFA